MAQPHSTKRHRNCINQLHFPDLCQSIRDQNTEWCRLPDTQTKKQITGWCDTLETQSASSQTRWRRHLVQTGVPSPLTPPPRWGCHPQSEGLDVWSNPMNYDICGVINVIKLCLKVRDIRLCRPQEKHWCFMNIWWCTLHCSLCTRERARARARMCVCVCILKWKRGFNVWHLRSWSPSRFYDPGPRISARGERHSQHSAVTHPSTNGHNVAELADNQCTVIYIQLCCSSIICIRTGHWAINGRLEGVKAMTLNIL